MLRFTEEEFQAFSERRNKGRSRPKPKGSILIACAGKKKFLHMRRHLQHWQRTQTCATEIASTSSRFSFFDYFERKHPLTSMSCCMQRLTEGNVQNQTAGKMKAEGQKKVIRT